MSFTINIVDFLDENERMVNKSLRSIEMTEDVDDNYFHELFDKWHPIYNWGHILQTEASHEEVHFLTIEAPNVSIIKIPELDTDVIALNGCGMDMTDSIAYAYMHIDRHIPKSMYPNQRMTLSNSSYALLREFINDARSI